MSAHDINYYPVLPTASTTALGLKETFTSPKGELQEKPNKAMAETPKKGQGILKRKP